MSEKLKMNSKKNIYLFWVLWILGTGIAWSLIIFPLFSIRNGSISSWMDLKSIALIMLFPCFFLGLLTAFLQFLVLKYQFNASLSWFINSIIGYSLMPVFAMGLIVVILGLGYPQTLSTDGQNFILIPTALTMILTGFLISLLQSFSMKDFLGKRMNWLWIVTSSLAWALAFVLSSWFSYSPRLQSTISGLTIGLITGAVFWIANIKEKMVMKSNLSKQIV